MSSSSNELLKDPWYFDPDHKPNTRQANELSFGRVKLFLFESLYRGTTKHDLYECFQLVRLLPKVTYLDPYILFRFIMILIESNNTESINKNVLIYLESLFSKLSINQPELFVELLSYFIKHNRIEDAQELYSQRSKYISYLFHQRLSLVDLNLKCYEFIFHYLQWKTKVESHSDVPLNKDLSLQGRLVNIIDSLKTVNTNHEYFAICLIDILIHYDYRKKAYLVSSDFQRKNPLNISAQLLHLYVLRTLELIEDVKLDDLILHSPTPLLSIEDVSEQNQKRHKDYENIKNFTTNLSEEVIISQEYPFQEDKQTIVKNLRSLDPTRPELLDNLNMHSNYVDILRDLMDGIEYIDEICNTRRWHLLKETLNKIFDSNDEILVTDARFLWHTRYKPFWRNIKFNEIAERNYVSLNDETKNLIGDVQKLIHSKLDRKIR